MSRISCLFQVVSIHLPQKNVDNTVQHGRNQKEARSERKIYEIRAQPEGQLADRKATAKRQIRESKISRFSCLS
jgi:hypothetical protein